MHIVPSGTRRRASVVARPRAPLAAALVAAALVTSPAALQAQRDTTRTDSTQAQRIEGVLVTAIRASDAAPIAQKTIDRATITRRNFGQDVPLLLQGASPSITAHTETGTNWGYSYLRLRGVDQTRINITIDGVPLNDMEDQVLYFANFADLMSNVRTVQVQRGVGTSSAGTASFAGSINFETMPIAQREASGEVDVQAGSFGAQRVSGAFNTGLTASRFAAYGRASALRTNGYRDHSGVEGRTGFLGAGWFGDRDILKFTGLVGLLADTLSYRGATRAQLAQSRRFNPLHPDERDRFGQQMFALSYTRIATGATSLNTTVYRNSASGNYDYFDGDDRYRFGLAHVWYGVTSAVNHVRGDAQLNVGINANTYARDHEGYLRPDLGTPLYANTGHKQDASAFVKLSYDVGRVRWFGDLQARYARFRYEPDVNAGVDERTIDWAFFNPKVGATFAARPDLSFFASFGTTGREPARNDIFAGDDDLASYNVDDIGDFSRVKPERVYDTELGMTWRHARGFVNANLYDMQFRNDIAPIGPPSASGAALRRNVGSSVRRGVEVDGEWRVVPRVVMGGNATLSDNRIARFTDSSRGTPRELTDVPPLLTPRIVTAQRLRVEPSPALSLSLEGRYQSKAYLDNTGSEDRVLPDFYVVDAGARLAWSRYALLIRGVNLGDTQKFGSGSVSSSGSVRYFVLPARSLFVTAEVRF